MDGGAGRVTYKEMVVGGLLDELLAVHDGLLEGGAESDHSVDRVVCSVDCQIFWKKYSSLCFVYLTLIFRVKCMEFVGIWGIGSCFLGVVDGGVVLFALMRLGWQGRGGIVERWTDLGLAVCNGSDDM